MVNNASAGTVEGSTFSDNLAGGNGGVLQVTENSAAVVTTSNFYSTCFGFLFMGLCFCTVGNSAQYGGAAYLDYNSTVDFESCKFENQNVHAFGAAVAAYRGAVLRIADSDISGKERLEAVWMKCGVV